METDNPQINLQTAEYYEMKNLYPVVQWNRIITKMSVLWLTVIL